MRISDWSSGVCSSDLGIGESCRSLKIRFCDARRVAMWAYLTAKTSYSSRSAMTMLLPAVLREANRRWTGRLGPHDGGGVELLAQQREQPVVLPLAVDLQVAPRQALLAEADLPQHPLAGDVVRQGGGLDPVQPQMVEREAAGALHRLGHVAVAGTGLADPVAAGAGLPHPSPHTCHR